MNERTLARPWAGQPAGAKVELDPVREADLEARGLLEDADSGESPAVEPVKAKKGKPK